MQVSEHVHALRIPFSIPAGPGRTIERFVHCWLVQGERPWLVDAGVAPSAEAILEFVRAAGTDPAKIDTLVLTHSHPDHIGGAQAIRQATGCRIAAHKDAVGWIEDTELQELERPVPGFGALVAGPVPVELQLVDGDRLEVGSGLSVEVIHTPGHSRGHIALLLRPDGALICGDALPTAGAPPVYEDVAASVASIERLMALEGVEVLLSSWDEPRAGVQARRAMQAALDYLERIGEAARRIAEGEPELSPADLAARVLEELGVRLPLVPPMVVQAITAHLVAGSAP